MLIIENIKNLIGTKFKLGKYEINCIAVDEIDLKGSVKDKYSYVIEFKLPISNDVPLVLWLERDQDFEMKGWRLANNLVDGEIWIENIDTASIDTFKKSIQEYLDNCAESINKQFVDDFII